LSVCAFDRFSLAYFSSPQALGTAVENHGTKVISISAMIVKGHLVTCVGAAVCKIGIQCQKSAERGKLSSFPAFFARARGSGRMVVRGYLRRYRASRCRSNSGAEGDRVGRVVNLGCQPGPRLLGLRV